MKDIRIATCGWVWAVFVSCLFGSFVSAQGIENIVDRPGQIVDHLYDISGVPAVKSVAFTPDGKELWSALLVNKKRGVTIFDVETGKKITDINLNGAGGVEIVFTKDGKKAYVSQMETAQVFEIDTVTKKILRILKTKSIWTKIVLLSDDESKLYAANWSGNNISEIDLVKGKLIRNISSVETPRGVYISRDGKYAYVAGFAKGEIQKINLVDGTKKIIFKSGGAMRHIVADHDKNILYVSDMGRGVIFKVDLATDKVTQFAKTDRNPNTIALSPDKKILVVSCRGTNFSATDYYRPGKDWGSVLFFDTQNGKMLDAIVGGNQPTALAFSNDGSLLAFSDFLDSRIEIYKIPSYDIFLAGKGGRSAIYKKELKK